LRRELAPTTIMESIWVDLALLAVQRLRTSAQNETEDSSLDGKWMRFQSMASRGLDKAMTRLEKARRAAKLAAEAASTQERSAHPPAPVRARAPIEPHHSKTPKKAETPPQETPSSSATIRATEPSKSDAQGSQRFSREINVLNHLVGTLEPGTRLEFLEQFRDEVNEMRAEGCSVEEVLDLIPVLSPEDVEAFQAGRPLSTVPRATDEPARLAV
jgi:hypothetical protein